MGGREKRLESKIRIKARVSLSCFEVWEIGEVAMRED